MYLQNNIVNQIFKSTHMSNYNQNVLRLKDISSSSCVFSILHSLSLIDGNRAMLGNLSPNVTLVESPNRVNLRLLYFLLSIDRPGLDEPFLEQWHQKLHTNTSPEDIHICEVKLLL